ncbi:YciI family protein [Prosthecobacter debontii]
MRVMIIIKATKLSESGAMPSEEMFAAMGKFNEALIAAGVMQAGDGLKPSKHGKRVLFVGDKQEVVDGPFPVAEKLVAGFWIWKVGSMDEALEWMKRCPHPMPGEDAEVELRPFYEMEDFGEELTPELREQEIRLQSELARQQAV